jgi:pSer/pThr/pTyr-binding forkhead associated (FHA) protein
MAKLIVKLDNEVIDHIEIKQGDMKIGRKPGCEIHLDNLAVSGEHANIFSIGEDSFIQDMNSTNGTFINNKRITKHHLRNGDSVVIGKYSLTYLTDAGSAAKEDFAKTIIINPSFKETPQATTPASRPMPGAAPAAEQQAALFVLSGANSGKRIEVTKTVTNLGKTGKRAGTITKTAQGYMLEAVNEGEEPPKLNGKPLPAGGSQIKNGDIIEVAGTRLQFYLR